MVWRRRCPPSRGIRNQANLLRAQPQARRVLKSSRWLLLRKRTSLQPQQAVHLQELLQANQPLMTVYVVAPEESPEPA